MELTEKQCLEFLENRITFYKSRLAFMAKAVRELREEYDKDEEVTALKKEIKDLQTQLQKGFYITEDEQEKIDQWIRERRCSSGAIGGQFTYEFIPTSIGIVGTIKDSNGDEFCFRELE